LRNNVRKQLIFEGNRGALRMAQVLPPSVSLRAAPQTNLRHRSPESLTVRASEAQQHTEKAAVFYYSKVKLRLSRPTARPGRMSRRNVMASHLFRNEPPRAGAVATTK
jgi:hypothetical protein